MEWFQILKTDYDLSYDRSQSSSLRCANEDWRACFPWASWLSACGSLGWRIWRFWSWKFMGSWQLVAINKKGEEKQILKKYRRDFRKNIGGTEDSNATHTMTTKKTMWAWRCSYVNVLEPNPILGTPTFARIVVRWGFTYFVWYTHIWYVWGPIFGKFRLKTSTSSLRRLRFRQPWCQVHLAHLRLEHEANHQVDLLIPPFPLRLKI